MTCRSSPSQRGSISTFNSGIVGSNKNAGSIGPGGDLVSSIGTRCHYGCSVAGFRTGASLNITARANRRRCPKVEEWNKNAWSAWLPARPCILSISCSGEPMLRCTAYPKLRTGSGHSRRRALVPLSELKRSWRQDCMTSGALADQVSLPQDASTETRLLLDHLVGTREQCGRNRRFHI
jgi:hypothetical protein